MLSDNAITTTSKFNNRSNVDEGAAIVKEVGKKLEDTSDNTKSAVFSSEGRMNTFLQQILLNTRQALYTNPTNLQLQNFFSSMTGDKFTNNLQIKAGSQKKSFSNLFGTIDENIIVKKIEDVVTLAITKVKYMIYLVN